MYRAIALALVLTGCAGIPSYYSTGCSSILECREEAEEVKLPTHMELLNFPPAEVKPIVAVYNFADYTGQRKRMDGVASFSTAVTQGPRVGFSPGSIGVVDMKRFSGAGARDELYLGRIEPMTIDNASL